MLCVIYLDGYRTTPECHQSRRISLRRQRTPRSTYPGIPPPRSAGNSPQDSASTENVPPPPKKSAFHNCRHSITTQGNTLLSSSLSSSLCLKGQAVPFWLWDCTMSPPRFLAEFRNTSLNQRTARFVLCICCCFYWTVYNCVIFYRYCRYQVSDCMAVCTCNYKDCFRNDSNGNDSARTTAALFPLAVHSHGPCPKSWRQAGSIPTLAADVLFTVFRLTQRIKGFPIYALTMCLLHKCKLTLTVT